MIKTYFYNHAENAMYHDIDILEKDELLTDPHNLLWVDMYECTEEELNYMGEIFDFHPLALEDCLQKSPRAKIDDYDDYYFFVFHALKYNEESEDDEITSIELDVFFGSNYIVTIHPTVLSTVGNIARISLHSTSFMDRGAEYLLYSMIDGIVDQTFPILDRISDRIDELEDNIFTFRGTSEILEEISALRRTLILMRKVLIPQRTIFSNVKGKYNFFIMDENIPYFLDLADHLNNILDSINAYRDLVNSTYETYYMAITGKTNEIITVLTVISVIMMPLSVITGFFGMNVPIPGQESPLAMWIILAGITVLALGMLLFFRLRKWM